MKPRFRLLPTEKLKVHEEIIPSRVAELQTEIERSGIVEEPIWVADGSGVILNGHHRFAALRALGARRIPAWVFDYHDRSVRLERWAEGPPLSKGEILERASAGRPFPPKTSRHELELKLPHRPTELSRLFAPPRSAVHPRGLPAGTR